MNHSAFYQGSSAVMAHDTHIFRNGAGHRGIITEDSVPYYFETSCGYRLDVDFSKCADDVQTGANIKRLSFKRRPRVASHVEEPQSCHPAGQWTSSDSLSSASSEDSRLSVMSSMTKGRPPLPPPRGPSPNTTSSSIEGTAATQKLPESKPLPASRSLTLPRYNPQVEKTLMETRRRLEQEKSNQPQPEPHPRRRLASFGGVGYSGSLSPFTGWGLYNQNNNGNKPTGGGGGGDVPVLHSSSLSSRGSMGSLRLSPQSSGRSTPVTAVSPMHLQNVRDQMVAALQRLKELEEQIKTIPVLQVKISVLQEEKRQLVSQIRKQNEVEGQNDVFRKRAHSTGSSNDFQKLCRDENKDEVECIEQGPCTGLKEFKQLTEEMQALERTIKGGRLQAQHRLNYSTSNDRSFKSVAVGTDEDFRTIFSKPTKEKRDASVDTDLVEMRSIATEVSEVTLGIVAEREAEIDAQQQIIEALQVRICQLETELKESTLHTEMSRLKLELQAAGARNRVDKACDARPSIQSTGTEAKPQTRSLGVGNHTMFQDASTGERREWKACTVGVSCQPDLRSVGTGPDIPMANWEVRERVETREQCVGIQVVTHTQVVGTEIKMCEAAINTDMTTDICSFGVGLKEYRSVACGECSVEAKEMVSHSTATDPVGRVDLGIMVSPQTTSQRSNTVSNSISRFTNTNCAFNTNSSTNTVLNTQDKHTNTTQTITRTVSVGNRVRDIHAVPKTRSVGVGTGTWTGSSNQTPLAVAKVMTRDTGVGLANINENFLVGLKTRNMACGPSHLPDPTKTRSVGVGEGKIRDFSVSSQVPVQTTQHSTQSHLDPGLDHYLQKMQSLLREQQGLLTESYSELGEVFNQPHSFQQSSPVSCAGIPVRPEGTDTHAPEAQGTVYRQLQPLSWLPNGPSKGDAGKSELNQWGSNTSEVKRKIQMMEQHASSSMQGRSNNTNMLRSIMKKQDGDRGCSGNRKSLKFMGVATGLEPLPTCEASISDGTKEDERKANKRWREISAVSEEGRVQVGQMVDAPCKDHTGFSRADTKQRFKLNEKMFSACQALRIHLSDDKALSSRELRSCLHTLQQEWFCVSSQKSANPAAVEDYLSAFRLISPSVLQRVANMADGNGNTALHYSVSHSNFHIVKKLLDAEVCNVNQQNKAGYTPIMLAALAAVETPEDMQIVEELFTKGDVNAKASQAGQTALMLSVSHGRMDMVQALLANGADVNLQDDEGSTALMCASEHGHANIVKLLLAQPGCNATLSDSDESTALSIALEAGHKDIAVLLYAHVNYSKGQAGGNSRQSGKSPTVSGGRIVFE